MEKADQTHHDRAAGNPQGIWQPLNQLAGIIRIPHGLAHGRDVDRCDGPVNHAYQSHCLRRRHLFPFGLKDHTDSFRKDSLRCK